MATPNSTANVVIVGAGLAGLFLALKLSPRPVTVISGAPLGEGAASAWAQGGIAAAVGDDDTTDAHADDTIKAGDGIVDEAMARLIASDANDGIGCDMANWAEACLVRDPRMPFFLWARRIAGDRLLKAHRFHLDAQRRDVRRLPIRR